MVYGSEMCQCAHLHKRVTREEWAGGRMSCLFEQLSDKNRPLFRKQLVSVLLMLNISTLHKIFYKLWEVWLQETFETTLYFSRQSKSAFTELEVQQMLPFNCFKGFTYCLFTVY